MHTLPNITGTQLIARLDRQNEEHLNLQETVRGQLRRRRDVVCEQCGNLYTGTIRLTCADCDTELPR